MVKKIIVNNFLLNTGKNRDVIKLNDKKKEVDLLDYFLSKQYIQI